MNGLHVEHIPLRADAPVSVTSLLLSRTNDWIVSLAAQHDSEHDKCQQDKGVSAGEAYALKEN